MLEHPAAFAILADEREAARRAGNFELSCSAEETASPGKTLIRVRLLRYAFPKNADVPLMEEKYASVIDSLLREDSLQFVDYWSVDFHYDGALFKPQAHMARGRDGIGRECACLAEGSARIAARVVDIFGNSGFRELEQPFE
jgi:hypothetical protein